MRLGGLGGFLGGSLVSVLALAVASQLAPLPPAGERPAPERLAAPDPDPAPQRKLKLSCTSCADWPHWTCRT